MKYKFYDDGGHGWLRVPTLEIANLGIADLISGCSYASYCSRWVYLEEDCDMGAYLTAILGRYKGNEEKYRRWYETHMEHIYIEDDRIRNLRRYPEKPGYSYERSCEYRYGPKEAA